MAVGVIGERDLDFGAGTLATSVGRGGDTAVPKSASTVESSPSKTGGGAVLAELGSV